MDVSSISNVVSSAQNISKAEGNAQGESSFSNIFSEALDFIDQTEAESQAANEAILTGESDDIHTALIASQKAEIAVSYAVEVRNKVVEAYNSIMNMQV
jgi:flagellar hook-basal body complex protein FliE